MNPTVVFATGVMDVLFRYQAYVRPVSPTACLVLVETKDDLLDTLAKLDKEGYRREQLDHFFPVKVRVSKG